MTGLTGGGYPTGYRNKTARELSMPVKDRPTPGARVEYLPPRPRKDTDLLTLDRWDRERNAIGPHKPRQGQTIQLPMTPEMIDQIGGSHQKRDELRRLTRNGQRPLEIDLSQDEYREIKDAASDGRWKSALRTAYRALRGVLRNRDLRLELAFTILDALLGSAANMRDAMQPGQWHDPAGWLWSYCPQAVDGGAGYYPSFPWVPAGWCILENRYPTNLNSGETPPVQRCIGNQSGLNVTHALDPDGEFPAYTMRERAEQLYVAKVFYNPVLNHYRGWFERSYRWRWYEPGNPKIHPWYERASRTTTQPLPRAFPKPKSSARPGGTGNWRPRGTITQEKPDIRVKQKDHKVLVRGKVGALMRGVNGLSEALDLVDVVYGALGRKCGARTPQGKIACIMANYETIDPAKLIAGYLANEAEDRFYGSIGRLSKRASQISERPVGFQAGGWDTEFSYNQRGSGFEFDIMQEFFPFL